MYAEDVAKLLEQWLEPKFQQGTYSIGVATGRGKPLLYLYVHRRSENQIIRKEVVAFLKQNPNVEIIQKFVGQNQP